MCGFLVGTLQGIFLIRKCKCALHVRPYTSPFWKGIRGEETAFKAVAQCYERQCCGSTAMECKARRFLRKLPEGEVAVQLAICCDILFIVGFGYVVNVDCGLF